MAEKILIGIIIGVIVGIVLYWHEKRIKSLEEKETFNDLKEQIPEFVEFIKRGLGRDQKARLISNYRLGICDLNTEEEAKHKLAEMSEKSGFDLAFNKSYLLFAGVCAKEVGFTKIITYLKEKDYLIEINSSDSYYLNKKFIKLINK